MSYNPDCIDCIDLPLYIHQTANISVLCERVFSTAETRTVVVHSDYFESHTILTVLNQNAFYINDQVIAAMSENIHTFYTADMTHTDDLILSCEKFSHKYLTVINYLTLLLFILRLKVSTSVMLLYNLQLSEELCNNTRMIIQQMTIHLLKMKIISDIYKSSVYILLWIDLHAQSVEISFDMTYHQFPVHSCFAMTINKFQRQSLSTVDVDLRNLIFSHDQLYITLS